MLVELLGCRPGQHEPDGAQAPALAPAPVAARAPPLASVPRCRGSRPDLRGVFDVGLDGWVIVVSRKSAAGTALRGRTHHSTPPSPLMSSGYGTPRQPRPRPIRVHTEEVTGSIPVLPTSTNAPSRSWEGRLTTDSDNNAGARARASAISYCRGRPLRWSPDQRTAHVVADDSAGTSRAVAAGLVTLLGGVPGPIRRTGLGR